MVESILHWSFEWLCENSIQYTIEIIISIYYADIEIYWDFFPFYLETIVS